MLARDRSISSVGDNGINNTGDSANIEVNYFTSQKILNKSYLYEFCLKFSELEIISEDYNTENASDFEEKMDYNEIDLYKDIFLECDHYMDDIEAILIEIPKRQRILTIIHIEYKRLKRIPNWSSKDDLCEGVYKYLIEVTENDPNFIDIFFEDKVFAIRALMYYSFTKCKLLDPIPKKDVG